MNAIIYDIMEPWTAAIQAAAAAAVVAVAAVAAAATTTIVRPGIPIRQVKMMMMTMMIS